MRKNKINTKTENSNPPPSDEHIGPTDLGCTDCTCEPGSGGQVVVDDLLVTCHCECHAEPVVYVADGESGTIRANGNTLSYNESQDYIWGAQLDTGLDLPAALSLAHHATGDKQRALRVHKILAEALISRLPKSGWSITRRQLLRGIVAIEKALDAQPVCSTAATEEAGK